MSSGRGSVCYFVIVGHADNPVYELDLSRSGSDRQEDNKKHLNQFIAHAALDLVDETKWRTNNLSLKTVDRFNDLTVTGFVTASQMCFILLYDSIKAGEDSIKAFFSDLYELFTKASLNPFYDSRHKLSTSSKHFDAKASQLAKQHQIVPL